MRRILFSGILFLAGASKAVAETAPSFAPLAQVAASTANEPAPTATKEKTLDCEVQLVNPTMPFNGKPRRIQRFGREVRDARLPEPFDPSPIAAALITTAIPKVCGPVLRRCVEERANLPTSKSGITESAPQGILSCRISKVIYEGCAYRIEQNEDKSTSINASIDGRCHEQVTVSGLNLYRKLPAENFSSAVLSCFENPATCTAGLQPQLPVAPTVAPTEAVTGVGGEPGAQ